MSFLCFIVVYNTYIQESEKSYRYIFGQYTFDTESILNKYVLYEISFAEYKNLMIQSANSLHMFLESRK